MEEEGLKKTPNNLIFIGKPIEFDDNKFLLELAELKSACYHEVDNIREKVQALVPTYHPKKTENTI